MENRELDHVEQHSPLEIRVETPHIAEGDMSSDSSKASETPYVVGIGASAGGLEALERFFESVPADSGMAYVVVQHLSPDFKSLMGEILVRRTQLPIHQAEDGMRVKANNVYLIPPKKNIIISGGLLHLADRDLSMGHGVNLPIDVFLRSLANDLHEKAIGIVLSGTGSDGTRGIRAVKEAGGLVIVQTEDSAKFDGMPRSAIGTGLADFVLVPEDMPSRLLQYVQHPYSVHSDTAENELATEEDKLSQIFDLLRAQHGIDFSLYREKMVARRIERRMIIHQFVDLEQYLTFLRDSPTEQRALYFELLISVTKFFRDADAFRRLRLEVIPQLVANAAPNEPIRVWVAACATGEEAYSVAIALREAVEKSGKNVEVKIFATDVDDRAIAFAARGVYPESIAADLTTEQLARYFVRHGDTFQVTPEVRQTVIFAPHNVIKDPPFTKMDLVCCRNLLIYLLPDVQRKVLAYFHFSLNPQGVLMLGSSEAIGDLSNEFEPIDIKWKIYRKNRNSRLPIEMRSPPLLLPSPTALMTRSRMTQADSTLLSVYETIANDHVAPCFLVNSKREIVYVFGDSARYLRVPTGRLSSDVLKMIHEDLSIALATALHKAMGQDEEVVYSSLPLRRDDDLEFVTVRVRRLPQRKYDDAMMLVFIESADPIKSVGVQDQSLMDAGHIARQRIDDLEHELRQNRENLQATIEELEASNEELQSTNEELLASNEELQSTNEELHSVNEELFTVNTEYQKKIRELIEANNDLDNLFQGTQVGTVFLDQDVRIRRFTPMACKAIPLVEHDIGRPLSNISDNLKDADLPAAVRRVLDSGVPLERKVANHDGETLLMRVLPYHTDGQVAAGVLLIFVDISDVVRAEAALRDSQRFLQSTLDALASQVAILDEQGRILAVNKAWRRDDSLLHGRQLETGANYLQICEQTTGDGGEELHRIAEALRSVRDGNAESVCIEQPCRSRNRMQWFLVRVSRFDNAGPLRLVVSLEDITVRVQAEEKLRRHAEELDRSRARIERQSLESTSQTRRLAEQNAVLERNNRELDDFAYAVSHDLREPIQAIRLYAQLLQRDSAEKLDNTAKARVTEIEQQADSLQQLIETVLEFSRLHRAALVVETIDINEVVAQTIQVLQPALTAANAEVVVPNSLPQENCDLVVRQVFFNLISNAIKYNDKPFRKVEVGCETPPKGGPTVYYVRDNGIGIREKHFDAIFHQFRRLHAKDKYGGGVGAGLAIVKKIIDRHGGNIWIESSVGEGTTFRFTLSRSDDANVVQQPDAVENRAMPLSDGNQDSERSRGLQNTSK